MRGEANGRTSGATRSRRNFLLDERTQDSLPSRTRVRVLVRSKRRSSSLRPVPRGGDLREPEPAALLSPLHALFLRGLSALFLELSARLRRAPLALGDAWASRSLLRRVRRFVASRRLAFLTPALAAVHRSAVVKSWATRATGRSGRRGTMAEAQKSSGALVVGERDAREGVRAVGDRRRGIISGRDQVSGPGGGARGEVAQVERVLRDDDRADRDRDGHAASRPASSRRSLDVERRALAREDGVGENARRQRRGAPASAQDRHATFAEAGGGARMARKSATGVSLARHRCGAPTRRAKKVCERRRSRTNITIYCTSTLTLDDSNARRPRRRTPAGCAAGSSRGDASRARGAARVAAARGRRAAVLRATNPLARPVDGAGAPRSRSSTPASRAGTRPPRAPSRGRTRAVPGPRPGRAGGRRAGRGRFLRSGLDSPPPPARRCTSPSTSTPSSVRARRASLDRAAKRSPDIPSRASQSSPDIPRAPLRARRTSLARLSELPGHPSRASQSSPDIPRAPL